VRDLGRSSEEPTDEDTKEGTKEGTEAPTVGMPATAAGRPSAPSQS
jgi:hypothetical protein